jgi:hypothetical protein
MRTDRYAAFGLTEADEPFRRAVRDGFNRAGLSRAQFEQALAWYRDNVRPGMDETELSASFSDFATNNAWDTAQLVAAQSVYGAIQQQGPDAVMEPTPSPEEDAATIAKANALLTKDAAAYFADQELQEEMFEALERQTAPQSEPPALGPPLTDVEIEQRIGRTDMAKFERMMRDEPGKYWGSPQLQAAYRDAIGRANAAPPAAPAEATAAAPEPVPPAAAPVEPRTDVAV